MNEWEISYWARRRRAELPLRRAGLLRGASRGASPPRAGARSPRRRPVARPVRSSTRPRSHRSFAPILDRRPRARPRFRVRRTARRGALRFPTRRARRARPRATRRPRRRHDQRLPPAERPQRECEQPLCNAGVGATSPRPETGCSLPLPQQVHRHALDTEQLRDTLDRRLERVGERELRDRLAITATSARARSSSASVSTSDSPARSACAARTPNVASSPAAPFSGSTPPSKTSWRTPSGGSPRRTLATDPPTATGASPSSISAATARGRGCAPVHLDLAGKQERIALAHAPEQRTGRSPGLGREPDELRRVPARGEASASPARASVALALSGCAVHPGAELGREDERGVRRRRLRQRSVLLSKWLAGPHELELADDVVSPPDGNTQD